MTLRGTLAGTAAALAVLMSMPENAASQSGSIHGAVYDSISFGPLSDAAVFLWDTPFRTVSDTLGRFSIENVPPGEYSILFFHTRLGELGVSAGPRNVTVRPGGQANVNLATPSMPTVVASQCIMEDRPQGSGAISGRIYDGDTNVTLGGALVTLSWHEEGSPVPESTSLRTGADGRYRSCAVPAGVPVLLSADFLDRRGFRREIMVEEGTSIEAAVSLYDVEPTEIGGLVTDRESGESVEGAETWLRGTHFRTLTDDSGTFAFDGVPPGEYMLMTDHLAYGTKMDTLVVPAGVRLTVSMQLDTRPIPMAPMTVTVEEPPVVLARQRGGIVITRDAIDEVRQRSRDASDILRSLHVPGVIVRHQSNGTICVGYSSGQVKMNQTGCVEMMIFVNDVRATDADLALRLPPDAIERMVLFKPVEAGNLFGLGGGNGVWMIYTRGN